jgi:formylglycine-generating enzyme required for sulfatase activity
MGSPDQQQHRDAQEGPRHLVKISHPIALGRYPITFYEFDYFCDATARRKPPDLGKGRGRHPVTSVTWNDAQDYVSWLSEATKRHYRLPTEAEWEYSCRAGTTTARTEEANIYRRQTTEVGRSPANPWGLYDMQGNVYQWCEDGYRKYEAQAAVDPVGTTNATGMRAARGGSFCESTLRKGRSASRTFFGFDHHFVDLGFCCARVLD